MRIEPKDGSKQKRYLAAMIMDDVFLAGIAACWSKDWALEEQGPFPDRWSNLVGSWCVEFWRRYGHAPKKGIRRIFKDWAESHQGNEMVDTVSAFLGGVSQEWQQEGKVIAAEYTLDKAGEYFNDVKISRLIDDLQSARDINRTQDAINLVQTFKRVELGVESSLNPLTNFDLIKSVLSHRRIDPLIHYPGDLGRFFGRTLERDAFIAFQGVEKSGKSFWLLDVVWRALRERRRVAYFCTGDMSEEQCLLRFYTRAAHRPMVPEDRWPCVIRYPLEIQPGNRDNSTQVRFRQKSFRKPTTKDVADAIAKFNKHLIRSQQDFLRLWVKPAGQVSVTAIQRRLSEWELDYGFAPDVICLAQGSEVLTDRGLVKIENIRCGDRLWDGISWVAHGGLVYKGVKNVITYQGLTATPDHLVRTPLGWRTIIESRRLRLPIIQTGIGRKEIRFSENSGTHCQTQEGSSLRLCPVCAVQGREVGVFMQYQAGYCKGVQELSPAQEISYLASWQNVGCKESLLKQESCQVPEIWWERDRISLSQHQRCLCVDHGKFGTTREAHDNRSNRQQRALRTWESQVLHSCSELLSYLSPAYSSYGAQVPSVASRGTLQQRYSSYSVQQEGPFSRRSSCPMEENGVSAAPVWDILNTGPLHRFTVQGLLVHNCIDYADVLAPITQRYEKREQIGETWEALRGLSQERHCLLVTATQAKATGYKKYLLGQEDFSDNKAKNAYVTGMVGINQTREEKMLDVVRLNWIDRREGNTPPHVHVAGCRGLANPSVRSAFA